MVDIQEIDSIPGMTVKLGYRQIRLVAPCLHVVCCSHDQYLRTPLLFAILFGTFSSVPVF
jgi:hypothetical protein